MALIVEDGTGLANAESFVSVAAADARVAAFAPLAVATAWAALATPAKENRLRQATEFVASTFYGQWKGRPKGSAQALPWPRQEAYDELGESLGYSSVPSQVAAVTADLAAVAEANPGLPLGASVAPAGAKVVLEEEVEVAGIKERIVYAPAGASGAAGFPGQGSAAGILPAVRALLAPLLEAGPGGRVWRS